MYAERHVAQTAGNKLAGSGFDGGWEAQLQLRLVRRGAKTVLVKRRHCGPLTVQRPFYPEGGLCHVYLLHPPGGVVAGDRLSIDIHAADGAKALITTPAAGKFYRSAGAQASQTVILRVDDDALLEWLPQESILFNGVYLTAEVRIELAPGARFIGWEITALGRPAANDPFTGGEACLRWRIFRAGQPLYLETLRLDGEMFHARWGLSGHSVYGTLFACSAGSVHRDAVRELIDDKPGRGVTLINDLLICRAVDRKTESLRRFFTKVRGLLRQDIVGCADYAPRIWAT